MVAHMMALPPGEGGIRSGGLPIRLLAQDVLRRAQAGLALHGVTAAQPVQPTPPAEEIPAPIDAPAPVPVAMLSNVGPTALAKTLRGFTISDLHFEARRVATEAAAQFEHLEGLAAGRTYGDALLQPGFLTPDCYRRAAADAKARAEMAGATADFLRGLLGQENALTEFLHGAAHG